MLHLHPRSSAGFGAIRGGARCRRRDDRAFFTALSLCYWKILSNIWLRRRTAVIVSDFMMLGEEVDAFNCGWRLAYARMVC